MDARPMDFKPDGILALEDGTVYRGRAFGFRKTVVGEAVFNTSMTGYQEILTDPSYYQQIVAMTTSQVGNYGEVFADTVGENSPLGISRGMNALWNEGGILYAPPIR